MTELAGAPTHAIDSAPKTGVLIHGRDVFAPDFNRMIWGTPDFSGHMGTIPKAVLGILENVPNSVEAIYIGSGATFDPLRGGYESTVIKNILCSRFEELDNFKRIRENPNWRRNWNHIAQLAVDAVVDIQSRNTADEIINGAKFFDGINVTKIIQVMGRDHAARATNGQALEAAKDKIPGNQTWYTLKDDESYPSSFVSNVLNGTAGPATLALETPHISTDPKFNWEDPRYWPPEVMRAFLRLPEERQETIAGFMREMIELFIDSSDEDFEGFKTLVGAMVHSSQG